MAKRLEWKRYFIDLDAFNLHGFLMLSWLDEKDGLGMVTIKVAPLLTLLLTSIVRRDPGCAVSR